MAEAVGYLSSLIEKELGLFLGFDQDLKRIASILTAIKATLQDAEEKQFSDRSIKDWLQKLKDAAHQLDDIMDEYACEELRLEYEGVKCCCLSEVVLSSSLSSFHPMHLVFRYKIAKEMKSISKRLDEIAEERKKFHLTEMAPERKSGVTEWRQTCSIITERQVYGRKEDTKKIVDSLMADASHSENLSVYPIVGLGGLGKTTLAQLIFNHERVVSHFEPRIWVCVSEDFTLKKMTKAIIQAASGKASEDLDLEPLQRKVQDLLRRKRYLLVLDDVWNDKPENWQKLERVLACGANGASILVTTRLPKVAAIMGTIPPHELSMLSHDDGWELFKHQAFEPNEVAQVELVDIGKEIVKKCAGVPLAAKAVGGLLRFERNKNQWLNVLESNLLEVSQNQNSIMPVLGLSYLNLPIELRQCFVYCAIFSKDEKIKKQSLIELWLANGFISSNGILDAEDVGDSVWHELYWRSFFQDIERDELGKVTSFKMHDLVHDLAQFFAEEICCITMYNDATSLSEKIHHLSDHRRGSNSIPMHQVKSLRTCLLPNRYGGQLSPDVLKCYSLRVLLCVKIKELSPSIGDLKHLRYLNLSGGTFKTLPESLSKLWNLQILKLDRCRDLQVLPTNLTRLKALQKLSLIDCSSLSSLPPEIGKLTSLKSLTTYFVGKESGFLLAELGALKLKGDLHIKHLERVNSVMDAKEANMSSKQLRSLQLSWDNDFRNWEKAEEILEVVKPDTQQLESLTVTGYKGSHFPQWMFTSSIKELVLFSCQRVKAFPEALQNMTALKKLILYNLPSIEFLPDCFGNFPLLHRLTIAYCYNLRCLPTSLSLLSSLEKLTIYGCARGLEKRCEKETGEDWPKIAHVAVIEVGRRRWNRGSPLTSASSLVTGRPC